MVWCWVCGVSMCEISCLFGTILYILKEKKDTNFLMWLVKCIFNLYVMFWIKKFSVFILTLSKWLKNFNSHGEVWRVNGKHIKKIKRKPFISTTLPPSAKRWWWYVTTHKVKTFTTNRRCHFTTVITRGSEISLSHHLSVYLWITELPMGSSFYTEDIGWPSWGSVL